MFKWIYIYWYNITDSPSNILKFNLWSYINIRLFKHKISSFIAYFILNLNNLNIKKLKIFYKNNHYDYIYKKSIIYLILVLVFIYIYMYI